MSDQARMLQKRTRKFTAAQIKNGHNIMRGFHKPQRDHAPKVQHPKPSDR